MIRAEVFHPPPRGRTGAEILNFHLRRSTRVTLLCTSSPNSPYSYHIKWKLANMKYKLKVCKLSLISELIALNNIFTVCHGR